MITVENLTKYYGDLCAVDRVNLQIRKGEIVGLLGPNGAGKTTTLRMLTCYLQPTSGTIRVHDYDIHEHSLQIKNLLGYLPESAPIYPEMLVYDYLTFVADVRGLDGDDRLHQIRHLADLCGLAEVMHKPVSTLSKGYKQRVGLAHALMNDPEILVLDEPTSGLDPNQIAEIRKIIRQIGREKTIILSTHILSEAEATCDRIVIINKGRIAADGSTAELRSNAGQEHSLHLVLDRADADDARTVLGAIAGVNRVVRKESGDDALHLDLVCEGSEDLRAEVYQCVKARDWILLEFGRQVRTLESIFRELTKED